MSATEHYLLPEDSELVPIRSGVAASVQGLCKDKQEEGSGVTASQAERVRLAENNVALLCQSSTLTAVPTPLALKPK